MWESLPPALAEIEAQMDELDKRIDTPAEKPTDLDAWNALNQQYNKIAVSLGICNSLGCLYPAQSDHPWCAEHQALADEILAELRAEWEAKKRDR